MNLMMRAVQHREARFQTARLEVYSVVLPPWPRAPGIPRDAPTMCSKHLVSTMCFASHLQRAQVKYMDSL